MPTFRKSARIENREDPVLPNRLMQRADQVILRDGADSEELLHQLVLAFGHQLDKRLMRRLGIALQHVRDRADGAAPVAIRAYRRTPPS